MDWKKNMAQVLSIPPLMNEPMRFHTSLRVGGPAEMLAFPANRDELKALLLIAHSENVPVFLIGQGTNLLVKDEGIRGIVINLARFSPAFSFINCSVKAGPGIPVVKLARKAIEKGLGGLEFAIGIPGSLGGAIYMNAGAYGHSIGDLVKEVKTMDYQGKEVTRGRHDIHFYYRKSSFQEEQSIIVEASLELSPADKDEMLQKVADIQTTRKTKQPQKPSAGSVFRNPPGQPAGYLIEKAGLKGRSVGGAQVSTLHGNFIVNSGGATAEDVLTLIKWVQSEVLESQGVDLELEIKIVGKEGIDRGD